MKLYYGHSFGERQEIADCETMEEVNRVIHGYIKKEFPNGFKSYYTRTWQDENGIWTFDVGSWSRFFYWDAPNFSYREMKEADRIGE